MEIDALYAGQPMRNSLDPCKNCEELATDAARYRWIRERSRSEAYDAGVEWSWYEEDLHKLDAAIDAAMIPAATNRAGPLTEEQIFNLYCASDSVIDTNTKNLVAFARAIEAAHGIA